MNPEQPPMLAPEEEREVLTAALRDQHGSGAVLEGWDAAPLGKRGRHRVIRYDVRVRLDGGDELQTLKWVGKFYDRDDDAQQVAGVLRRLGDVEHAHDGLVVPQVLAYHSAHRLLLLSYESGESVIAAMARYDGVVLGAIGRALAALHGSAVAVDASLPPEAVLEALRPKVAELCARYPAKAPMLRQLLSTIENQIPPAHPVPCLLHGDLGSAQLLWKSGHIVVLDFDNCARGDPALDLGSLLTQLRRLALRKPGKLPPFPLVHEGLLAAYRHASAPDPALARRVAWYELSTLLRKVHFLAFDSTRHPDPEAVDQREAEAIQLLGQLAPQTVGGGLPQLVALRDARARRNRPKAQAKAKEKPRLAGKGEVNASRRKRLRQFYRTQLMRVRWSLVLAGVCTVGTAIMDLLAPWPLKLILDHGLLEKPLPDFLWYIQPLLDRGGTRFMVIASLSIVAIAVLNGMMSYFQKFITSSISYRTVYGLRRELFSHLQRLSLSFHTKAKTGDLLTRIAGDTATLKDMVSDDLLKFCSQVLTIFGMIAILIVISWPLALIAITTLPFLSFSLFHLYRKTKASVKHQKREDSKVAARMIEVLSAINLVQAFGREEHEEQRFDTVTAVSLRESIRVARLAAAASRSSEIITALGTAAVVLYGALQVMSGNMLPGMLVLVVAYLNNLYRPLRGLAKLSTDISKAMASADRLSEVLDIEPDIREHPEAVVAPPLQGQIEFRNVSFDYGDGRDILKEVSFTVAPGQRVALVGASGAGKSTIGSLILRLYEARRGTILIDGVDIERYTRDSLRSQIAIVLQESILFGASVKENIAYGNPEASPAEIEAAARDANAHDFIAEMPNGYDTIVGERGATLSGGQQQRLAIARALIRNAPILILDEPMTGLDVESEAKVREALDRLMAGRTCLMITHDLQSIADAHQVLVLENGQIADRGTHAELLASSNRYRELYELDRAKQATEQSA